MRIVLLFIKVFVVVVVGRLFCIFCIYQLFWWEYLAFCFLHDWGIFVFSFWFCFSCLALAISRCKIGLNKCIWLWVIWFRDCKWNWMGYWEIFKQLRLPKKWKWLKPSWAARQAVLCHIDRDKSFSNLLSHSNLVSNWSSIDTMQFDSIQFELNPTRQSTQLSWLHLVLCNLLIIS